MIVELKDFILPAASLKLGFEKKLEELIARKLKICSEKIRLVEIVRKSLDCRHKEPEFHYTLFLEMERNVAVGLKLREVSTEELEKFRLPQLEIPSAKRLHHPIVVGTGPAGIFCAFVLASAGTEPVVLEWGSPIRERYLKYRNFVDNRVLNESDNLLIGEGGAGAFSDGKLYTGTKSEFSDFILKCIVDSGTPEEIRYAKRPHIGSDYLRKMVENLREKIKLFGGTFRFHSKVTDFLIRGGECGGVLLESGETLSSPAIFVAPGLGGREIVRRLLMRGVEYSLKPFQIGCRIEHPQTFIDQIMYHTKNRNCCLGAAEYHLLAKNPNPAWNVSSFCMCPGGEVLNATAWNNHSISNGMSNFARNGEFGNSCLITTLPRRSALSRTAAFRTRSSGTGSLRIVYTEIR